MDENTKKEVVEQIILEVSSIMSSHGLSNVPENVNPIDYLNVARKYFKSKNEEWINTLRTSLEISEEPIDELKCAEYLQFLHEIARKIPRESRDSRRKHLLDITKNYFKLLKYVPLDRQIMFLDILDNLSEEELDYLLFFYNKKSEKDISAFNEDQYTIQEKLTSSGLLNKEIKNLQSAFKVMNLQVRLNFENIVKEINKIRNSTESYYDMKYDDKFNPYRDGPEIVFSQSLLGLEFVSFVLGDVTIFTNPKEQRMKEVKENITNAVLRFKR